MTYQGARARPFATEQRRVFAVTAAHWDAQDQLTHVRWVEVVAASNLDAGPAAVVTLDELIDALHAGAQVRVVYPEALGLPVGLTLAAVEHPDGHETVALASPQGSETHAGPGWHGLERLTTAELGT